MYVISVYDAGFCKQINIEQAVLIRTTLLNAIVADK
jgi:hypothetical protein